MMHGPVLTLVAPALRHFLQNLNRTSIMDTGEDVDTLNIYGGLNPPEPEDV
jgi:hypothetical protein